MGPCEPVARSNQNLAVANAVIDKTFCTIYLPTVQVFILKGLVFYHCHLFYVSPVHFLKIPV